ncbi:MAG: tryptophan-rich sensory protein [Oscillospiraceae bacterium]|nr:tryptophan-rich sensory protein [Oscillospiraceae bacterium]
MKKSATYLLCVLLVELAGFAVGMLTAEGTRLYADSIVKPPLSPPGIVFPIAWTLLYALMAIGLARMLLSPAPHGAAVVLFFVQLALNLAWCFIFFGAQRFDLALAELLLMAAAVVAMTIQFARVDRTAAWLQLPYLVWLCFATYLNIGVLVLN